MATPTGAQGFDKSVDDAYTIIRPGVQTDHLLLTNAAGGGLVIGTGSGITFPATTPAATTTRLTTYAYTALSGVIFTGPWVSVSGSLTFERIGNTVRGAFSIPVTATTANAGVQGPAGVIPTWARPSLATFAISQMEDGGVEFIAAVDIGTTGNLGIFKNIQPAVWPTASTLGTNLTQFMSFMYGTQ